MQINYAIFGEQNNGHGLLAASGNTALAAKLTSLTDRPGDPPAGADWGPIFSGFAFEGHYVFLKIQRDSSVRRAGMVRSFAAYIPFAEIGRVNNIGLLYSRLPSDLGAPPLTLNHIGIDDAELAKDPDINQAIGRATLARLLTASDSKLPLLWTSTEPYLPTIANLWAQFPPGLRENFSFYFLFAPEHHTVTAPTVVATLPEFGGRWATNQIIRPNTTSPENLTPAQRWLAGSGDRQRFEETLRAYAIELPRFSQLSVVVSFVEMVSRLDELTFSEARKSVYTAARYSRRNKQSAVGRSKLFNRFCAIVRTAPIGELLKLRNLEDGELPDLISDLQSAMAAAIASRGTASEANSNLLESFETAVAEPKTWWSSPFLNFLKEIGQTFDTVGVEQLLDLADSSPVVNFVIHQVSMAKSNETRLLDRLPSSPRSNVAANLSAVAEKRSWWRLHAACLARSEQPTEAIARHVEVATTDEGLETLERELGFRELAIAACRTGAPALVTFVGTAISKDAAKYVRVVPASCKHLRRILHSAVLVGKGALADELRSLIVKVLDDHSELDASFEDLCKNAVARDPSLLLDLSAPADLVAQLSETIGSEVDSAFEDWLRAQLQAAVPVTPNHVESFKIWLDERPVIEWLSQVPLNTAVAAGINCFRSLPYLTDADCQKWLIKLFTRTARERLTPTAAAALADFLSTVEFPESATIVRDTAIDFHRADVAPIHDQIRYKYQMAGVFARKPGRNSSRLHPVLVVTALPLERKEVIAYLPSATYDMKLLADVAEWPADNPFYEIYLITSGAGNLTVLGAINQFLKHGIKPRIAFFVGVCGGVKDSQVGDVVFSTKVYYTEGGKEEDDGVKARPAMKETNEHLVQLAIRVSDKAWQPGDHGMAQPPKASPAVFAASEQVLASTASTAESYQRLKKSYNDTQAVDMEAYGFLKAMHDDGVNLSMVLRGVSDKLAKKEESDSKGSQPLAARNVAAFLFPLLEACRPFFVTKKRPKKSIFDRLFNPTED